MARARDAENEPCGRSAVAERWSVTPKFGWFRPRGGELVRHHGGTSTGGVGRREPK
jgi:hypothetical protein